MLVSLEARALVEQMDLLVLLEALEALEALVVQDHKVQRVQALLTAVLMLEPLHFMLLLALR